MRMMRVEWTRGRKVAVPLRVLVGNTLNASRATDCGDGERRALRPLGSVVIPWALGPFPLLIHVLKPLGPRPRAQLAPSPKPGEHPKPSNR